MYEYSAKLVRVVDGDTVDLEVDLGFSITVRDRFRLDGIDTPERGQKGFQKAKTFLTRLLKDKELVVRTAKAKEKYGRYLAEIFVEFAGPIDTSVNAILVAKKLAVPYDGGKKDGLAQ